MNKRSCDSCFACCTVFGFTQKPESFECEWLKGSLREEYHPNSIGLVFSVEENRVPLQKKSLVARESIPNSFTINRETLDALAKKRLIVLQKKSSFDFLGPSEDIEKINHLKSRFRQQ